MPTSKAGPACRGRGDTTEGLMSWLLAVTTGTLLTLVANTTPSPSHRPVVTKWSTRYAKTYEVCKQQCLEQFAVQAPKVPLDGRLAVVVEIICQRPKVTILSEPKGDTDNFTKCPLDAATQAGVWVDDSLIVALGATKRWTSKGESPGIKLTVGRLA